MASMNGESEEPSRVYKRKSFKGVKEKSKTNVMMQRESDELSDGGDLRKSQQLCDVGGGKFGFLGEENRVTISLASKSKKEVREFRRKLLGELDLVRNWMKKIEAKERDELDGGRVKKKCVRPEVEDKPLNQLSVSVVENSQAGIGSGEKEKRTPKVNQFYQNSEFLLGKDKIPAADKKLKGTGKKQGGGGKDNTPLVDKKSKGSGKKQNGGDPQVDKKSKGSGEKHGGGDEGSGSEKVKGQFLKTCRGLLQRLMKHKNGWVFNVPVDANALGLHDYFDIIKAPMDLGTVKSRLDKNFYQSPMEFMVDVRLTFRNAMTYNPKGQDVYVMAEQLLQIFEEKWAVIEADYVQELKLVVEREDKSTKKPHSPQEPPVEALNAFEHRTNPVNIGNPGRPAAPKKPKARDPNKREMTYAEKQTLSSNLQSLPADKLENVVDIIKKRTSSLRQHDDEIEVDIDSFDKETLWELDRFVINYKKYLSKNRKNSELAKKVKPAVELSDHNEKPAPVVDLVEETQRETIESSPGRLENQTKNKSEASKSSGSSSASTDSGSSNSSG
ncbi:transcription factor GTE4-like isoform X2 [Apium graveolens]|uniref:transcription factor GTE4-like isoform X2 n=1 Tax=Apium graveolens TaxID=4045 RepID=UPI003D79D51C